MHANSTLTRLPPQLPIKQIAVAVQALIDLLDVIGGDPELEDDDPAEATGDELDAAWTEGSNDLRKRWSASEDDEEPDEPEVDDEPEDDDPGGCEHDGREPDDDAERETWAHPDDHPAELFIGRRPANANNPLETA